MKRSVLIGIICIVLASVCYGITPILTNTALNGGLPAEFVERIFGDDAPDFLTASEERAMANESVIGVGMGMACLLSALVCAASRRSAAVCGRQAWQLCLFGGGAFAATMLLISYAYRFVPAGMAIVLHFTYPIIVMLAMLLFFKERFTPIKLICVLAAVAGVALISGFGAASGGGSAIGVVIAVCSGITYAVYFLAGKNSAYAALNTNVSNIYITGSAFVICAIISALTGRFSLPSNAFLWCVLTLQAIIGYVVGLQLLIKGIRLLGSTTASALNTLEPVFASITSMLVFGEAMSPAKGAGIALVLAAAAASILTLNSAKGAPRENK